ncbi:MAG TPA: c-type cytochrome biogenesis protein CcmI [Burkholderiales bacterium]|jgi:cytochrome c-type biogenesis protein CcmH|nr:c-type cytochrome biogenesis protein CcmI [Burkholderiales bacterium]
MILFWLIGAVAAAAVIAWVLRPLLTRRKGAPPSRAAANVAIYRDQLRELDADLAAGTLAREDYERARAELETRALRDAGQPDEPPAAPRGRGFAWALAGTVPVAAVALYLLAGNPAAIDREAQLHASRAQVEAMVERLSARLRENPDDVNGWKLLGRSYGVMGRYAEATDAYAKAAMRAPRDAQLLADLADVLAMARGQSLQGEPEQLALRALEIEPGNLKALALAGSAAFERKDYAAAAKQWERMLAHVEPNSEDARAIQQNVAEARSLAGEPAKPEEARKSESKKAQAKPGLRGTVSLSPKLKDQASPDDTVFVFARATEGPPMPLAVARVRVRDLPYRFALDDSMAMSPALKLSAFPKVVVAARVSKSGTATAQPGDLQGASAPVANDAAAVSVVIDTLVR